MKAKGRVWLTLISRVRLRKKESVTLYILGRSAAESSLYVNLMRLCNKGIESRKGVGAMGRNIPDFMQAAHSSNTWTTLMQDT